MSIESPTTYGEWYWHAGIEASSAFDETLEQALSPYLRGVLGDIPEISELPPGVQNILRVLGDPPTAGLGTFVLGAGAEFTAEMLKDALRPATNMLTRAINRRSLETWLTPQEAVVLNHRKKIDDDFFYLLTASAGYDKIMADFLHTSQDPFPAFPDLIRWARYQENPDNPQPVVMERYQIDHRDWEIWDWLSKQVLTTEHVQRLYVRDIFTEGEASYSLAQIGWAPEDRELVLRAGYALPNPMLLAQAGLLTEQRDEELLQNIAKAGIHPDYAQAYLDAIQTKPASQDVLRYLLRQDPSLSDAEAHLKRLGIHPA